MIFRRDELDMLLLPGSLGFNGCADFRVKFCKAGTGLKHLISVVAGHIMTELLGLYFTRRERTEH